MDETAPAALGLDLNTCNEQDLASVCKLGGARARQVLQARPLRSWDDVRRLAGFDDELVRQLQHAGARIGGSHGGGDRPGRVAVE